MVACMLAIASLGRCTQEGRFAELTTDAALGYSFLK